MNDRLEYRRSLGLPKAGDDWHCANCGAPGIARSCDCVTDVVCRCIGGKHHHEVKVRPSLPPERNPYAAMMTIEQLFEEWWTREGKKVDPDTADISWFDKRKGLALAAFVAAMAQSSNYVCDKACEPTEATFANGRRVWIRFDENDNPFLHIERAQP